MTEKKSEKYSTGNSGVEFDKKTLEWMNTEDGIRIINKLEELDVKFEILNREIEKTNNEFIDFMNFQKPDGGQLYNKIGKFIVEFSKTETILRVIFCFISGSGWENGKIILTGLDFRMLSAITEKLLKEKYSEHKNKEKVSKIFSKLNEINDYRNIIVHGTWEFSDGGFHSLKTSRSSFLEKMHLSSLNEFDKFLTDISNIQKSLLDVTALRQDFL